MPKVALAEAAAHIEHIARIAGVDHVGLGSIMTGSATCYVSIRGRPQDCPVRPRYPVDLRCLREIKSGAAADMEISMIDDFAEGYLAGRTASSPEPNANRSNRYRHSFAVGRAEIAGQPIHADVSRAKALKAEEMDRT